MFTVRLIFGLRLLNPGLLRFMAAFSSSRNSPSYISISPQRTLSWNLSAMSSTPRLIRCGFYHKLLTTLYLLSQKRYRNLDRMEITACPEETVDKYSERYVNKSILKRGVWWLIPETTRNLRSSSSKYLIHHEKCGFGENLIKDLRRHLKFNRNLNKHSDGSRNICISISIFIGAPYQRLCQDGDHFDSLLLAL